MGGQEIEMIRLIIKEQIIKGQRKGWGATIKQKLYGFFPHQQTTEYCIVKGLNYKQKNYNHSMVHQID